VSANCIRKWYRRIALSYPNLHSCTGENIRVSTVSPVVRPRTLAGRTRMPRKHNAIDWPCEQQVLE
jgi:hypothetical protein